MNEQMNYTFHADNSLTSATKAAAAAEKRLFERTPRASY